MGLMPESKPEQMGDTFLVSNTHPEHELYFRLHPKLLLCMKMEHREGSFPKCITKELQFYLQHGRNISVGRGQVIECLPQLPL